MSATLVSGPDELLRRRAVEGVIAELRDELGEVEVIDVAAAELRDSGLPEIRTASLFGAPQVVVIRDAHDLGAALAKDLASDIAAGLADGTHVVVAAKGIDRLRALSAAVTTHGRVIKVAAPAPWDTRGWQGLVRDELARFDRRADAGAVDAVLEHAGADPSGIAAAAATLAAQAPPGTIDGDVVDATLGGHGAQGLFAISDAIVARDPAAALSRLRGEMEAGADPIALIAALTSRFRAYVAAAASTRGAFDPADAGLNLGRQLSFLRRDLAAFGPGDLTRAYRTLLDADDDLKGNRPLPPALIAEVAVVALATTGEFPGGTDGHTG